MTPLYIFDLDGTIALIDHRRHMLKDVEDPNRWRHFSAACDKDQPNVAVIETMRHLRRSGSEIWIFSGRSDEVRGITVDWLAEHTHFMSWELETALIMRPAGDYTPDDVLKKQWLDMMLDDDRRRLVAAFDDRDKVVQMWRANGVACFQVASGEF